jgi:hypothetical protein
MHRSTLSHSVISHGDFFRIRDTGFHRRDVPHFVLLWEHEWNFENPIVLDDH